MPIFLSRVPWHSRVPPLDNYCIDRQRTQFWLPDLFSYIPSAYLCWIATTNCLVLSLQYKVILTYKLNTLRNSRSTVSWYPTQTAEVPSPPSHFFICWSFSNLILSITLSFHAPSPSLKLNLTSLSSPSEKLGLFRAMDSPLFPDKIAVHKFQLGSFPRLGPQNFPALTSFWKEYPD